MQNTHPWPFVAKTAESWGIQPQKRAYSVSDWQRDFTAAFAANVPVEAAPTKARGLLLVARNDEAEGGAQ